MLFQQFRYSSISLLRHVQPGTRTVERMERVIKNMIGHVPRQGFQPVDTGETGPVGYRMKNEPETGPLFGRQHIPQSAESFAEGETDPRSQIVEVVKTFRPATADQIEDLPVVLDMSQNHEPTDATGEQVADFLQVACIGHVQFGEKAGIAIRVQPAGHLHDDIDQMFVDDIGQTLGGEQGGGFGVGAAQGSGRSIPAVTELFHCAQNLFAGRP